MNAAQDLADLASLLSDVFAVYVPDRRGRGMSGPFGPGHSIARQIDDVRAYCWTARAPDMCSV